MEWVYKSRYRCTHHELVMHDALIPYHHFLSHALHGGGCVPNNVVCCVCVHAGRYLSVDTAGELSGKSEAVGQRETWEPVFEEVDLAEAHAHTGTQAHTHTHTRTHTAQHSTVSSSTGHCTVNVAWALLVLR